jgi:hypothetical protein
VIASGERGDLPKDGQDSTCPSEGCGGKIVRAMKKASFISDRSWTKDAFDHISSEGCRGKTVKADLEPSDLVTHAAVRLSK